MQKSDASGCKVSHLESWLPQRFNLRASGQITAAFLSRLYIYYLRELFQGRTQKKTGGGAYLLPRRRWIHTLPD